jgi:cysteinyl-tRNA synthetase
VLQAENLKSSRKETVAHLAHCGRDWMVLDASFEEGSEGRWTPAEIAAIRAGKPNRKVLAYFSIGEAEDYRTYWKKDWDRDHNGKPDSGAPAFLAPENPDWKGNYRVRYWQKEWQDLLLPELERIAASGFDGVYLDLVDAFEFFEYDPVGKNWMDNGTNPETGRTYRQDMVAWIERIATVSRASRPEFLVVPQNGSQLLADDSFLQMINAIGIEDLFTEGNKAQPDGHTGPILKSLQRLQALKKPVLLIEYGKSNEARRRSIEGARKYGCVLLLTGRELKSLGDGAPPAGSVP